MNNQKLTELKSAAILNSGVFTMSYYSEILHSGKKTPLMIAKEIWPLSQTKDLDAGVGEVIGISPFEKEFQYIFNGKWEQHDNTVAGFCKRIDLVVAGGVVPNYDYHVEGLSEIEM